MDKSQLKEDLRNLTLSEVCEKYGLRTLGELLELSKGLYTYMEDEDNSFITKSKSDAWRVNKYMYGENVYFGTYDTKEEALKVRDELIEVNWDKDELDRILIENNIEMRK